MSRNLHGRTAQCCTVAIVHACAMLPGCGEADGTRQAWLSAISVNVHGHVCHDRLKEGKKDVATTWTVVQSDLR